MKSEEKKPHPPDIEAMLAMYNVLEPLPRTAAVRILGAAALLLAPRTFDDASWLRIIHNAQKAFDEEMSHG